MPVELDTLTFDTASPTKVAASWAEALGFEIDPDSDEGAYVRDPSGRTRGIFFRPVPEAKTAKNRPCVLRGPDDGWSPDG